SEAGNCGSKARQVAAAFVVSAGQKGSRPSVRTLSFRPPCLVRCMQNRLWSTRFTGCLKLTRSDQFTDRTWAGRPGYLPRLRPAVMDTNAYVKPIVVCLIRILAGASQQSVETRSQMEESAKLISVIILVKF